MLNKSDILNFIILSLYIIVLAFVIIIYYPSDEQEKNVVDDNFYKLISEYSSYQEDMYDDYYKYYLENNNIILSLNMVNTPNYYNFDLIEESIDLKNLRLINQKYFLPETFIPTNLAVIRDVPRIIRTDEIMMLSSEAYEAYIKLYNEAKKNNLNIYVFSSYRPYDKQTTIYNNSNNKSYVAKPGHSEHQTGLVVDISTLDSGLTIHFENTKEFRFLKENAHKFGFILRYPKDKSHITGYSYEPWHYRYVGVEHAKIIYDNSLTLEEYIYNYIPL